MTPGSYRVLLLAIGLVLLHTLLAAPHVAAAEASTEQPPELRFTVRAFRVTGDNPLSPAQTDALLAPFLGEYTGVEGLLEAANTVEQALAQQGFTFHRVVLPAQTLLEGTVELEVVAFRLGEIFVNGNEHFSRENILRSLPGLRPGETPRPELLSQQRYIAKLHPSKQVQLRLKESDTLRAIDAQLDVEDSAPEDVFLSDRTLQILGLSWIVVYGVAVYAA